MENQSEIGLTATEMSGLWAQYINDTASICVNTHFLEKTKDSEVRPIVELALSVAKHNIAFLEDFFKKENFPVPNGFTDKDVVPDAPKLFSDTFVVMYLRQMSMLAMAASSGAIALGTREMSSHFIKPS